MKRGLIDWNPEAQTRTRRHEQQVSDILNALIQARILVQTGPDTWTIQGLGSGSGAGSGIPGPRGQDANRILQGLGVPPPALGREQDLYFQTDSAQLWQKTSPFFGCPPRWNIICTIPATGPQGLRGPAGASGSNGSQGLPGAAGQNGSEVLLSSQTLLATTATVTFSAISQAYTSLRLLYTARGTAATTAIDVYCTFNSDGAANYDQELIFQSGTTVTGFEALAQVRVLLGPMAGSTSPAGACGAHETVLVGYSQANFHKPVRTDGYARFNTGTGNSFNAHYYGFWRSTAAITRIDLAPSTGSFAAGCIFSLYGVL